MNKTANIMTVGNPGGATTTDKSTDWQLELLMEKLRSKASQLKSLQETSKTVRLTMLDKRYSLDSVEKSQHQKCLDTLQHCIKVTSLQSMIERLESLTRQLGLKFMVGPSGTDLFISSDMFYLEIILESTGAVRDVKVHHEGKMEQQSCAELVSCLTRQDFNDFTAQLEGFASIYQLNAEKKIKCKAFTALQSLESDLTTLAELQTFMKEPFNLLHKSPVGILEKRKGGHPMKLTYFVSPYDLLDTETAELKPITVESVISKNLGYSVTVCMEGSAAHKLQTTTLITVNRNFNGKSTPSFAALTNQNSAVIPACFMLKLNKPMPMCVSLIQQIQQLTELECVEMSSTHPLLSLIVTHASDGQIEPGNNKGLFVTLPEQQHCYFLTDNKSMEGILVHSIPFTHPGHVSQILVILRQQALFNSIISSCVRPNSKQDLENMIMFEISALSWTHISISMEHPVEETMATAEVDLTEISNLQCRIHSPGTLLPLNTPDTASELATKILNRCLSIPVTMRSIIKLWDKQVVRKHQFNGHENFSLPLGSGDPGGHKGPPGNSLTEFGGLDGKLKQEPSNGSGLPHGMNLSILSHSHQGMFLNESMMASANFSNFPTADVPMFTSMELTNILAGTGQSDKSMKRQKRKGDDFWKSSKRKAGDDAELMETSSSDSMSHSTPLSQEAPSEIGMMTPTSVVGFQSDLELSGLDPAELIGSSDKALGEYDNIDELGDVEEMLAASSSRDHKIRKLRDLQKSPSLGNVMEMQDKSLVSPSVSITPISTPQGFNGGNGAQPRPGIEIIPITTTSPNAIPSSITITPISSSQARSIDERSREKKSSKSRSEDKNRLEKKRKRKRDESPMGPPEKIPPKQDPLTKPVTVSIKPAESPPLSSTPTSPSGMRKFSSSPTHSKSFSVSGKLSPSMMKSGIKSAAPSHPSPKHSPAQVSNSPKHTLPGISSPKSHATSPKHPSTGSSGKPSMSTLKSAANSPSNKSSGDIKKSTKDSSRDKDKKSFNMSSVNKVKSSSVKLKQLDLNTASDFSGSANQNENVPSPPGAGDCQKTNLGQVRNRKGSLSAVIDKLKSAQHCDGPVDLNMKQSSNRERSIPSMSKTSDGSKNVGKVGGENKNSEYMVKPSSDGMKITINKTRTKESSKSMLKSQSSGSGSPKTHTGLKPGVNSGPASKKPQQFTQKSSSSPSLSNSSSGNYGFKTGSSSSSGKTPTNLKSSTISSKSSKLSGSPKTGPSDLSRSKDRPRLNKSTSDKSIFSSSRERKSSPTQSREESESEKAFKLALSKMDPYSAAPLMSDGMMKQLDKNFQIPKLSARNAEDKKTSSNKINTTADALNNISRNVESTKMYDMIKNDVTKYPLSLSSTKMYDSSIESKIRNSMNMMSAGVVNMNVLSNTLSPKSNLPNSLHSEHPESDIKKDVPQNLSAHNFAIPPSKPFASSIIASDLSTKSVDLTSKFASSVDTKKDAKSFVKDVGDVLLDFSSTSKSDGGKLGAVSTQMLGTAAAAYPPSSSVSVHIVKSPAPSANSGSPCITDDELMDEALVGLGK
uniref:Mediator of RNA polymerase II transcription subunit 1 n=1 Tax=Photinus pyralis TaxID=7054 RepID=A0A1Y1L2C4_PHOPY